MLVSSSWRYASWGDGVGNRLEPGDRIQEAVRDVVLWRSFRHAVSAASVEAALQPASSVWQVGPVVRQRGLPSRRCIDFPVDLRFQSYFAPRGRLGKLTSTAPTGPGASAITSNGAAGPSGPNACVLSGYSRVNSMITFSARASRFFQPGR
jgi:hypothetical protein